MSKVIKRNLRNHAKASERYVDVIFQFDNGASLETSVPIEYRRTGTDIKDEEIDDYIEQILDEIDPSNWPKWKAEQEKFWSDKPGAGVTRAFFDALSDQFAWRCVTCSLPANPNFARRIQDLKEFGYTIATHTNRRCEKCGRGTTQLVLLPIRRGGVTGYETWTPALRARIISALSSFDAFEAKVMRKESLLPDHKFPEVRWDAGTRRDSLEHLTEEDIKRDFQLLSNQRNQQKREVCRGCFQTGIRGSTYGISFYYEGNTRWDERIPKTGKSAEKGCIGCGWYDIETWRRELAKKLQEH
jgi:hypothetical protein